MKLERKINNLITLFNKKQYDKVIFETESNFDDKEINSQVLLILGLARIKSRNRNFSDVLLAIQNFKKGYILEKKSKIGLECLIYYLYGVGDKVKQEFEVQIVDNLKPLSYDLTRTRGRIEFIAQMSMDERLTVLNEAPAKQLTFADLQALPTSKNSGKIPKNPIK